MQLMAHLRNDTGKNQIVFDEGSGIFWIYENKTTITTDELLQYFLEGKLSWVQPPRDFNDGGEEKTYVFDAEKFLLGENCPRALYLDRYKSHLAAEGNDYLQLLGADGMKVRELAYRYYGGGKFIYTGNRKQGIEDTFTAYLAGEPIIYGGIVRRCDGNDYVGRLPILIRAANGYKLVSTTTSTELKPRHLTKLAYLGWLAGEAGLRIESFEYLHPNKNYRHDGIELVLTDYFTAEDVSESAQELIGGMANAIEIYDAIMAGGEPERDLGSRCSTCKFSGACKSDLPEHNIFTLPRITASKKVLARLKELKISDIASIPTDLKLSDGQERRRYCVLQNRLIHTPEALSILDNLAQPLHFIDFETLPMAIPRFRGMKPHQHLAFQWSNHIRENGKTRHEEYLDTSGGDCRREFLETLLKSCESAGTILIYSSFERARMKELAEFFPKYAAEIDGFISRFFDLEKFIGNNIDHPQFYGRTSIKVVLPAMYGENLYRNLAVHNGTEAITAYASIANPRVAEKVKKANAENLLRYCELDTMAMVIIYDRLRELLAEI